MGGMWSPGSSYLAEDLYKISVPSVSYLYNTFMSGILLNCYLLFD